MSELPDVDAATDEVAPVAESADAHTPTGDPVIDEALLRLDSLDSRPVQEHPAELEAIHRVLRDTLSGQRTP